ncbi:MAG TPA: PadR family transcriptional regulator [Acidobacteriota bacterium]|nr:PadR family transcriptional regulator [Acidobacteriota bacterium]
MSLEHILLGMLRAPSTGYDLGKQFAEAPAHFWFAERSQIYPMLKRMESQGLLRRSDAPSERGPRRQVYETTEVGREALRDWLRGGPKIGRERLGYVAQTFFLGELGDLRESRRIIKQMRSEWAQKVARLELAELQTSEEHGDLAQLDANDFHHYAALRMGLSTHRARIAWCDETIKQLDERIAAIHPEPVGEEQR